MDVGNTHTVIGLYQNDRLIDSWRVHTEPKYTEDEFHMILSLFFDQKRIQTHEIRQIVISCVVPPVMKMLDAYCRKYLDCAPHWVESAVIGMPNLYSNPAEVGADRLVNAVAAYHKYKKSLIIIDFGTATTFDCISEKGAYIGGAIAPGIGISAEALFQRASKLPRVELFNPPSAVIGKDTVSSMKSGLLYGYAEMVDGMVHRIQKEMAPHQPKTIATGGLSVLIKTLSATIESVEPDLTLEGLLIISKTLS